MAKAYANCTCKTCGKTFEKTAIKRNCREADSWKLWAEKNFDECDECAKARIARFHADENAKAAEQAAEEQWSELTGSEKQIAWANSIRAEFMTKLEAERKSFTATHPEAEAVYAQLKAAAMEMTEARFWIDHRNSTRDIVLVLRKRVQEAAAKAEEAAAETAAEEPKAEEPAAETAETAGTSDAAEAPKEEPAVKDTEVVTAPETQTHTGVVEILAAGKTVSASYVREDEFRMLVKGLGYEWRNNAWRKDITATSGSAADRAAELGSRLLNAGYAIHISDPAVRAAAVNGDYEPEHRRWISCRAGGTYEGWFSISWPREDDLYKAAKALPGARYDKPQVVVPAKSYESVLDFAETYDFRLTTGAQELVDAGRARVERVTPAPVREAQYNEHRIEDVLDSSREVLPDLMDD